MGEDPHGNRRGDSAYRRLVPIALCRKPRFCLRHHHRRHDGQDHPVAVPLCSIRRAGMVHGGLREARRAHVSGGLRVLDSRWRDRQLDRLLLLRGAVQREHLHGGADVPARRLCPPSAGQRGGHVLPAHHRNRPARRVPHLGRRAFCVLQCHLQCSRCGHHRWGVLVYH